ncbi:tyrosine-type recombinase/integrase [Flavobacterium sp. RSB2_4_14]|uniref:tyrosine-type recombinase/integrase n=1 Tax=Flavobacterium sp. RSB2_4_14 TaxID=3447665 RepID=UPI003F3D6B61
MKVNFILKGKNNPTKIICRFKPTQNFDFTHTTIYFVRREDWSKIQQRVKQNATTTNRNLINSKLRELEDVIFDKWNLDNINKSNITKNWLKNVIDGFSGKVINNELHKFYYTDWIDNFISDAPKRLHNGKPISYKTIQQYAVTQKKIIAFEKLNDLKLRFEDIDLKFYTNFVYYCRNNEKLGDNSINGHIKNIKLFCKNIEQDGLPINIQYKHSNFKGFVANTQYIYFKDAEIDTIFNYDFSDNERLANARDLFIIGLRTGLRVSDFLRLQKPNLKEKNIVIETIKTKQTTTIPMHPQIVKILQSRNGEFPRTISEQKFNLYIKEICKTIGFSELVESSLQNPKTKRKEKGLFEKWQLVSSHVCRRSFATNLYGKLPNKVIMAITTHKSEAQFLAYIKTTNEEFAEILGNYWNKENNE